MALDTRDKRASSLSISGIIPSLPLADGTVSGNDRPQTLGLYRMEADPPMIAGGGSLAVPPGFPWRLLIFDE